MNQDYGKSLREFRDRVEDYGRRNPYVHAYEALRNGEDVDQVIGLQSVELWEQIAEAGPDEGLALHHLAIVHHGAGFRMHATETDKSAALEQWRRGLEAWKRLLGADAFWDGLRRSWQKRVEASEGGDMLAQRLLTVDLRAFRRQIPRQLLSVHVAFVQDGFSTDPELARQHLDLIRNGPFAGPDADRLCSNLYRMFTADLGSLLGQGRFAEARQKLETFLEIDPENERALLDLLRTTTSEVERMKADGRPLEQRKQRMESAAFAADRLQASGATKQYSVAGAVRDFFCSFTAMFIDAARDLPDGRRAQKARLYQQGFTPAKRALAVETLGDRGRNLLSVVCYDGAMSARACGLDDLARRLIHDGLQCIPDDPSLHAVKALLHWENHELTSYQGSLQEAERLNRINPDRAATSVISHLRTVFPDPAGARRQDYFNRANEAIQRRDYHEALRILKEADCFAADVPDGPALKASCYCRLLQWDEAQEAYIEAKKRGGADPGPGVRAMLKQVEVLLRESKPDGKGEAKRKTDDV
jgi:tetratricopeptide (TPR) repeat protein